MVALTRYDCMLGSSALMAQAAKEAIWHTSGRSVFGKNLHDQPLMLNVLADLALEADDIEVDISGSGKVVLEGIADEIDLNITGSGDLRAFNITAREGNIKISGSGDAEVRIEDRLDVRITGSGDVYYKGQPLLDVSITGSGEVIDAN